MKPDSNGFFQYTNIMPGQYFLVVNDSNSDSFAPYIESQGVYILGDSQSMMQYERPVLLNDLQDTSYKLRVVLTWTGQESFAQRDLDIFAEFQLSNRYICTVGFYLPLC